MSFFLSDIDWLEAGIASPPVSMTIAYQPIVSCNRSEDIFYSEALARFVDAENQLIEAGEVVAALESMGHCHLLDGATLALVLGQLVNDTSLVLGWNLSADSVRHGAWPTLLKQIKQSGHASRLVIELTEYRPLNDANFAIDALLAAQELGCKIALDDFGTGYATPELLLAVDFDIIKVDKIFLHRSRSRLGGLDTFQHLVGYASYFAPHIVAEGVESKLDLERASRAGVTHVQGYFFARPAARMERPHLVVQHNF
ncbi:EAL domain-containing protein [Devosia sp. A369]